MTTPGPCTADTAALPRRRMGAFCAQVIIWYFRVVATLDLLAAISVPLRNGIRHHNTNDFYTPFLVTAGFTSAALATFLAVMLNRRKRAAWIFSAILMVPLSAAYVSLLFDSGARTHPFNWCSIAIMLLTTAALLAGHREFTARGERGNVPLAAGVFVGGAAVYAGIGTLLLKFADNGGDASVGERAEYLLYRAFTLAPDSDFSDVLVARWVDVVVNIVGVTVFLLVLYVLFRAPKGRELLTADDEVKLRALLDKHGERDSLGYFALRRDKAVMWSPSGKAAVAYRVVGGVTLASGDPIGDPEAWPGAIERWLDEARANAWVPAVMGASEEGGTIFARHGLDALELGDEAIVEYSDFTLEGRAMRVVRQAYNRVKRAGYTTRIRRHEDIPEDEMRELLDLADHWRDGETERGFSMALGRLGDPDDGRCVMVECTDGDGKLRAVLSFVPWGEKGLSLDLMRRDRDSENGLLEFMIIDLIQSSKQLGIEQYSLNFAMFRSVFERGSKLGAGPVLRLWRAILMFFSRWWQIESLYRANAKYRPIWEPRYLCFRKASELPRIGLASARAEGFVTAPSLPSLFGQRHAERLPAVAAKAVKAVVPSPVKAAARSVLLDKPRQAKATKHAESARPAEEADRGAEVGASTRS